jgi:nitroimidazol reductase NimA-like FMN-containing flavoprotein (pyridoxamine 5'-phosphate oxidase superfamily)
MSEVMAMLIQGMTLQASFELLARATWGRLACAHDGQPYIAPISFACDAAWLYGFSTVGRKITWMRANPLVCIEADEVTSRQNWATVIVLGRYEELPDKPASSADRTHAYDLLQRRPVWWEPGYAKTVIDGKERALEGVYFRIHIDQITGHRGIPDGDSRARG